jgi:hypothetical protein
MRAISLVLLVLLGGCSFFDSVTSGAGPSGTAYDPPKIYLGSSTLLIPAKQVDHYACIDRPLVCEHFGAQMECRCLY